MQRHVSEPACCAKSPRTYGPPPVRWTVPSAVVTQRLQKNLGEHNLMQGKAYENKFSVGVVHANTSKLFAVDELLAIADTLMYDRKRSKSN